MNEFNEHNCVQLINTNGCKFAVRQLHVKLLIYQNLRFGITSAFRIYTGLKSIFKKKITVIGASGAECFI